MISNFPKVASTLLDLLLASLVALAFLYFSFSAFSSAFYFIRSAFEGLRTLLQIGQEDVSLCAPHCCPPGFMVGRTRCCRPWLTIGHCCISCLHWSLSQISCDDWMRSQFWLRCYCYRYRSMRSCVLCDGVLVAACCTYRARPGNLIVDRKESM